MKTVRQPRYQQIAIRIAEKIVQNEFKVGQKLSSRSTLATTFGVSAETARKAISILSDLEIVDPVQGSGVIVLSQQRAQSYLAQYQEVQSIQALKKAILTSIVQQQTALTDFSIILDQFVEQIQHFQVANPLAPMKFVLTEHSEKLGMTLGTMNLWQNTGATVIAIFQKETLIVSPGPYATLNQGDTLYFVGNADTLQVVQNFFAS